MYLRLKRSRHDIGLLPFSVIRDMRFIEAKMDLQPFSAADCTSFFSNFQMHLAALFCKFSATLWVSFIRLKKAPRGEPGQMSKFQQHNWQKKKSSGCADAAHL